MSFRLVPKSVTLNDIDVVVKQLLWLQKELSNSTFDSLWLY